MIDSDFDFVPPPEAPVFEPTLEEFTDPLVYIAKIKPIAERAGICKIRPPANWLPPFAIDIENFTFTPRVQRLNELEAKSRIKLNFLDNLAKFWELQGNPLKIPQVERKYLDLYLLHKIVAEEGGFEVVLCDKKWTRVAARLGFAASSKSIGSMLKTHYEKLLYPYDIFRSGVMLGSSAKITAEATSTTKVEVEKSEGEQVVVTSKIEITTPSASPVKGESAASVAVTTTVAVEQQIKVEVPSSLGDDDCLIVKAENVVTVPIGNAVKVEEGGSLEATGTGNSVPTTPERHSIAAAPPVGGRMGGGRMGMASSAGLRRTSSRMSGGGMTSMERSPGGHLAASNLNAELKKLQFYGPGPKAAVVVDEETGETRATRQKTREKKVNYADMYFCEGCGRGDDESRLLLCDSCDDAYHTYCLLPPLSEVPKGEWSCHKCIAKECCRPKEAYGFEQAQREYSLQSFGEMADQMKMDYFNMPVHMVPYSVVEKEFWRLVSSIEDSVIVEYGADIHVAEMGSGFPTSTAIPDCEDYVASKWNLNNLPVNPRSILQYINADISGMKIPWCYVGMCFSCFAWHNEDHWSYSINYLHWGEPKTWYGVPGAKAELLEQCMRKNAPELFEQSPDLLHQLTTFMNPNILMAYGVPVFRTNQCAGEFIVTFPRAYHTGFNQGYNFAEAVNFCPADWIPWGRACVDNYRQLRRQCVFSHEEIICKMAADHDRLDLATATAVYQDLLALVDHEVTLRKQLLDKGIVEAEREAFELLPDDERQCAVCKTTCFLSAVTCSCCADIVCVHHSEQLCQCSLSSRKLRYRYTLDELPMMVHKMKSRVDAFDSWTFKVRAAFEAKHDVKLDLLEFKDLLIEADEKNFPRGVVYDEVAAAVKDAEKCASVAQQLIGSKMRTRMRQSGEGKYTSRLTLDELKAFVDQILALPCRVPDLTAVQELVKKVESFQKDVQVALDVDEPDVDTLDKLTDAGTELDIDVPEVNKLKHAVQHATWLKEVKTSLVDGGQVTIDMLRRLIGAGVTLVPEPRCERMMSELQQQLTESERCEERAKTALQARPRASLEELENIVAEAEEVPVHMPSVSAVDDALRKAREWIVKVDALQGAEQYPHMDQVETLIRSGRPIPAKLEQLTSLESQVLSAKAWMEKAARTFIKKNSRHTLLEVLSPASNVSCTLSVRLKHRRGTQHDSPSAGVSSNGGTGGGESLCDQWRQFKDAAAIVAAYKAAEEQEATDMMALRAFNMQKGSDENDSVLYCICQRPHGGLMLQCELCKDWFHNTCVPMPKSEKNGANDAGGVDDGNGCYDDVKFLCPLCQRSRRPRLETILTLLMSLQKLTVRLSEGEALQCLTERAIAWQDRARQALADDGIAAVLAHISSRPPRAPGGNAHTTGLQHQQQLMRVPELPVSVSGGRLSDEDPSGEDARYAGVGGGVPSEHTYSSSVSWTPDGMSASGNRRQHVRKTPLVPRRTRPTLTESQRAELDTLMMEGDLIEVAVEETEHIWRLLQANNDADELHFEQQPSFAPGRCGFDARYIGQQQNSSSAVYDLSDANIPVAVDTMFKHGTPTMMSPASTGSGGGGRGTDGAEKKRKKKLTPSDGGEFGDRIKKRKRKKLAQPYSDTSRGGDNGLTGAGSGALVTGDREAGGGDEACSASQCLQPLGEEVSWVQCDRCELWFHMLCVGLQDGDIADSDEYICRACAVTTDTNHATSSSFACAASVSTDQRRPSRDADDVATDSEDSGPGSGPLASGPVVISDKLEQTIFEREEHLLPTVVAEQNSVA